MSGKGYFNEFFIHGHRSVGRFTIDDGLLGTGGTRLDGFVSEIIETERIERG